MRLGTLGFPRGTVFNAARLRTVKGLVVKKYFGGSFN